MTDLEPTASPAAVYAQALRQLHELTIQGKDESPEADAIRDAMDGPWYALTAAEQDRLRGLSADLYALAEQRVDRKEMTAGEKRRWGQTLRAVFLRGDADQMLMLLRHPPMDEPPLAAVRSLQARAWERLGDLDTALLFMRVAERLDPGHAVLVLTLLKSLGRATEGATAS